MGEIINGYELLGEGLKNDNAGTAKWGFARKNNRVYFIKQFLSPSYPMDDSGLSYDQIMTKRGICREFELEKGKFYNILDQCRTGNIITVHDFFRFESKYYAVTERVDAVPIPLEIIAGLSMEQKLMLAKVLLYCMSSLHDHGIVHGDLKPDNILMKWTKGGRYTVKVIDFDSSFLESNAPGIGDDIHGDMVYFSPEAFLLVAEEDVTITRKIDSFAVGLIIHQYFTGHLPKFDKSKYDYAFEAVLDESTIEISNSIPRYLADMIRRMLDKNPDNRPEMNEVFDTIMDNTRVPGQEIVTPPGGVYNVRIGGTHDSGERVAVEINTYIPENHEIETPDKPASRNPKTFFRKADDWL